VPLAQIGSRALFTKQIDDAMLEGRIDLAVHSLKDLPTTLPAGIALVAVGEREDPRDALVGRGPLQWTELPRGAVLATSSLRRRAQLLHLRPDLEVRDIRGNVDTRLAKWTRTPSGPESCWRRPASCGSAWPAGSGSGCRTR
jgi:Porphobilinogen deaminase